jgi:hypothetical protein
MFANVNHNSKSQLAKLLAAENITVQHVAGQKTAWFDVKNRILSLPIWKEMSVDLYDMLVIHEVGHALDTPNDAWANAIDTLSKKYKAAGSIKGFMNIIEDARIDRLQKIRFPGSRRNYVKGYKELIDKNFFGTVGKDVNKYSFIDRANIYFKGGSLLGIKFNSEEKEFLKKMDNTQTFEDVVALTDEIYAWAKAKKQEELEQQHDDIMSEEFDSEDMDFGADGDDWDDDDFDADADADSDDEGDESDTEETDGEGDEEAEGSSDEEVESNNGKKTSGHEDGENNDEPEAKTEKAWQDRIEDLLADGNTVYHYVRLPEYNISKIVTGHKAVHSAVAAQYRQRFPSLIEKVTDELTKFKSEENQNISFMVKEFEMKKRADEYARTSINKTGVIDVNKLFSYKYNEDLFRRNSVVRTGKNHGFVMFVDWSGSMYNNLEKTMKQLFSLVWFCKRSAIPFEVYSFRNPRYEEDAQALYTQGEGILKPGAEVVLREFLNSNMAISEMNAAMVNLLCLAKNWIGGGAEPMTGTPLLEAMTIAPEIIEAFQKKSRVQIVNTIFLTDGAGGSFQTPYTTHMEYGKKNVVILQDAKTGKSYELSRSNRAGRWMPYATLQKVLLQRIKDRTGCNVIGFYLADSRFTRAYREVTGSFDTNNESYNKARKSWRDEKFFEDNSIGYDSFYVVDTSSMKNDSDDLEVDSSMTKAKIAKNFAKFNLSKKVNRVLLRNFIEKIAA